VRRCYYLENPRDGRGIFVLPWQGGTMVGTTETAFDGDPDTVAPRPSERRYLRSALLQHFPDFERALPPSLPAFAGLRVLPAGDGHAFHRPRETRLITDRDTGRPRGFGFVEMGSSEDAANAIQHLNGYELGGRQLNVNEARERTGGGGRRGF